jgi:hypothetical protein
MNKAAEQDRVMAEIGRRPPSLIGVKSEKVNSA